MLQTGNLEENLKAMVLSTIESIIKLNTKISACISSKLEDSEKKDKLDLYDKKLINLVHILYPAKEFARKILEQEHKEYLYILDFIENKYKSHVADIDNPCIKEV